MKFTLTVHNLLSFFPVLIVLIVFSCNSTKNGVIIDDTKATSPSYYADIAVDYYNNKEYRNTIKTYNKLIDTFLNQKNKYEKDLAWAYYEIGFCYLLQKKYDKAKEYFNIVLSDYSQLAPRTLAKDRLLEIQSLKTIRN